MGSSRQYFGNNAHWIPMPLHDLIISSVKEIIMNNYSFFQVVVWYDCPIYIILKFFLKAVNYIVMLGSAL